MNIFWTIIDQFTEKQKSSEYWVTFGRESDLIKGYPKAVCYFYLIMLDTVIKTLDLLYSQDYPAVNVDSYFAEEYSKYIPVMLAIQRRKNLPYTIPKTEFRAFRSLHDDFEMKKPEWLAIRELWLADLAVLSDAFGEPNIKVPRYHWPLDLEKSVSKLKEYSEEHRVKQIKFKKQLKPYDWKDGVLSLREKTMALQKKSNPYKVFDLLERNFFEKVSNEALQKTISGNLNDVTSAISYLRERIREAGLSKFVKIKATGKGGYLLEIS